MSSIAATLESIFAAALEIEDPSARRDYLDRACAGKLALRAQLDSLLAASARAGEFLESPLVSLAPRQVGEGPGSMVGPYRLIERIGEGGMGTVYLAEQSAPVRREVALKIVKPGMDTRRIVARFEAERQALALMDHPNIAKVLDAGGTSSGRPYFVMELVRGLPITEYCERERLSLSDRLRLFASVCRAVHHAHQKGIIHRDLKPSNVLTLTFDGVAVPKVIDFGVAKAIGGKLTDQTLVTAGAALVVGTPLYMSPEQVSGIDVDTRGDIYSLGVLLYELITGVTPFDRDVIHAADPDEIRRLLRDVDPPPPSARVGSIGRRGELDWIVMKALEKDRRRRYETANDLADDILRHLNDQPVEACPPSGWYRLRKFTRRNRAVLAATTVAGLAILGGLGAAIAWRESVLIRHNRELSLLAARTEAYAHLVERNLDLSRIESAARSLEAGRRLHAQELLAQVGPSTDRPGPRGFVWRRLNTLASREGRVLWTHDANVNRLTLAADGKTLAVGDVAGTIVTGDLDGERPLVRIETGADVVDHLAVSNDGRRIASIASGDSNILVWNSRDGQRISTLRGSKEWVPRELGFTADGNRIAVVHMKPGATLATEFLWIFDLTNANGSTEPAIRFGPVIDATLDPRGESAAMVIREAGRLDLIDLATGSTLRSAAIAREDADAWLAFSGDGQKIAAAPAGRLIVRDVSDLRESNRTVFPAISNRLIVNQNGSRFVGIDRFGIAHAVDPTRGSTLELPPDNLQREIRSTFAALSPDGRTLVTSSWGLPGGSAPIKVWNLETGEGRPILGQHAPRVSGMRFAPDGRSVLVIEGHRVLRLPLDPPSSVDPPPRSDHGGKWVWSVAVSPNGRIVATGGDDGRIVLRDRFLDDPPTVLSGHTEAVDALAFTPDGRILASGSQESSNNLKLWDLAGGRPPIDLVGHTDKVRRTTFDRAGKTLATASFDRTIRTWDATSGRPIHTFTGHTDRVHQVVFSPDGSMLASASDDSTVRLWNARSGRLLNTYRHPREVFSVAFSPDGSTLAAGDALGVITLRDPTGRREPTICRSEPEEIRALLFTPDGQSIVSAGEAGPIRFRDAAIHQEIGKLDGHSARVNDLTFTPDGLALLSVSHDGTLRTWESVPTPTRRER